MNTHTITLTPTTELLLLLTFIMGRSAAARRLAEKQQKIRQQQQKSLNTPIGQRATQNGKPVIWAGVDYGWQSPGSYQQLETNGDLRLGSSAIRRGMQNIGNALPEKVKQIGQWWGGKLAEKQQQQKAELQQIQNPHLRQALLAKGGHIETNATRSFEWLSRETNIAKPILETSVAVLEGLVEGKIGLDTAVEAVVSPRRVARSVGAAAKPSGFGGDVLPNSQKTPDRRILDRLQARQTAQTESTPLPAQTPKTAGRAPNNDLRSEVVVEGSSKNPIVRVKGNEKDLVFRSTPEKLKFDLEKAEVIAKSLDDRTVVRGGEATRRLSASYGEATDEFGNRPGQRVQSINQPGSVRGSDGRLIPSRNAEDIGEVTQGNRIRSITERRRAEKAAQAAQRAARRSDVPHLPANAPKGGYATSPSGVGMIGFTTTPPVPKRIEKRLATQQWNDEVAGRVMLYSPDSKVREVVTRGQGDRDFYPAQLDQPVEGYQSRIKEQRDALRERESGLNAGHTYSRANPIKKFLIRAEDERLHRIRQRVSTRRQVQSDLQKQGRLRGQLERGEDMSYQGLRPRSPRAEADRASVGLNRSSPDQASSLVGDIKANQWGSKELIEGNGKPFRRANPRTADVTNENRTLIKEPIWETPLKAATPDDGVRPLTKRNLESHAGGKGQPSEPKEYFEAMLANEGSKNPYDTLLTLYFNDLSPDGFIPSRFGYNDQGYKFAHYPMQTDLIETSANIRDTITAQTRTKVGILSQQMDKLMKDAFREPRFAVMRGENPTQADWKKIREAIAKDDVYGPKLAQYERRIESLRTEIKDQIKSYSTIPERVPAGSKVEAQGRGARKPTSLAGKLQQEVKAARLKESNPQVRQRADGTVIDRTLPGQEVVYKSDAIKLAETKLKQIDEGLDWNIYEPGELENPTALTARKLQAEKSLRNTIIRGEARKPNGTLGTMAMDKDSYIQKVEEIAGQVRAPVKFHKEPHSRVSQRVQRSTKKGTPITRQEQTARNQLQSDLEIDQDLTVKPGVRSNHPQSKGRVQDRFTRRLEAKAAKESMTTSGRRRPNAVTGRARKGETYDRSTGSFNETEPRKDARRLNRSIKRRQKTDRYQQEFGEQFPQADPNERREAYGVDYSDGGKKRTDNESGKESIRNQFREARARRGHGDTRVRRSGKKFTDVIGRSTDVVTKSDEDVANLVKRFPYLTKRHNPDLAPPKAITELDGGVIVKVDGEPIALSDKQLQRVVRGRQSSFKEQRSRGKRNRTRVQDRIRNRTK